MKLVYLAGPISGLSFNGAVDWRQEAIEELSDVGIRGLSPMRYKEYLKAEDLIIDSYEEGKDIHSLAPILSSSRGITTRDRWDVSRCDVLLVNLLGAKTVSIGTVMEIAWADAYRKPTILVMEEQGNLHDHSMIRESIGYRVTSMEDAIEVTKALLV